MSETMQIETPARPKRKYRKAVAKPKAPNEMAGLTVTDCPPACTAERCVFSWKPYCAHPRKGGLQGAEMNDKAALERIKAAKKRLAHAAVERRT